MINTATGAIAQRMDFDEWANATLDTAPGFQPFGFAGGLLDAHTGLTRFGARDYDPRVGRWTAKDPIGFRAGTNFYAYVGNNPTNWLDPTGLAVEFGPNASPGVIRQYALLRGNSSIGPLLQEFENSPTRHLLIDEGSVPPFLNGNPTGGVISQLAFLPGTPPGGGCSTSFGTPDQFAGRIIIDPATMGMFGTELDNALVHEVGHIEHDINNFWDSETGADWNASHADAIFLENSYRLGTGQTLRPE